MKTLIFIGNMLFCSLCCAMMEPRVVPLRVYKNWMVCVGLGREVIEQGKPFEFGSAEWDQAYQQAYQQAAEGRADQSVDSLFQTSPHYGPPSLEVGVYRAGAYVPVYRCNPVERILSALINLYTNSRS